MNTAMITIKTDPQIKKKAQKAARNLGFSLSSLVNAYLRHFLHTKTVFFSENYEQPSDYLLAALKESESARKRGDFYSFDNPKDALRFLDKVREGKYED
jgi:antitoxin component of RelBE/YafQ-DinJ toxin-antitoxin module